MSRTHKATGDEPLEVVNSGAEDWVDDLWEIECPRCGQVMAECACPREDAAVDGTE